MIRRLPGLTALLLLGCCGLASAQTPDSARRAPSAPVQSQTLRPSSDNIGRTDTSGRIVRAPGRGNAISLGAPSEGGTSMRDTRPVTRWTQLQ